MAMEKRVEGIVMGVLQVQDRHPREAWSNAKELLATVNQRAQRATPGRIEGVHAIGAGSGSSGKVVGAAGLEPATSCV
jgi:hypothetical protein